jgi:hypothetical protein
MAVALRGRDAESCLTDVNFRSRTHDAGNGQARHCIVLEPRRARPLADNLGTSDWCDCVGASVSVSVRCTPLPLDEMIRTRRPPVNAVFGEVRESDSVRELQVDTRGVTPNSNPSEREDGKPVGNGVRPLGWRDDQYPSPARAIADGTDCIPISLAGDGFTRKGAPN